MSAPPPVTAADRACYEECDRQFWAYVDEWLKDPKPETRPCPVSFFAEALAAARAAGRAQGWRERGAADVLVIDAVAREVDEYAVADVAIDRIRALPAAPPEEAR